MVPKSQLDEFRALHKEYFDDQALQPIIHKKKTRRISRRGSDDSTKFTNVSMVGIISYNFFRTWPSTKNDVQGDWDNQNMVLMFHKDYLIENNFVNEKGNLDYSPGEDKFIINGVIYKDAGFTDVSQVANSPIFEHIILCPDRVETGTKPH